MKIYVVNLDKDIEKMFSVAEQLKRQMLEYERISAVYGRDLTKDEIRSSVNLFRWWCAVGRQPVLAEIGCGLSHQTIYRKMLEERVPIACILEDDVALAKDFSKRLDYVARNIDIDRPQVVLLSDHITEDRKDGTFVGSAEEDEQFIRISNDYCTEGYCLTLKAAEALLGLNKPLVVPIDSWGRFAKCKNGIKLFHAKPTVCSQMQTTFGSSTSNGRCNVSEMNIVQKLIHIVKRCTGLTIDRIIACFD